MPAALLSLLPAMSAGQAALIFGTVFLAGFLRGFTGFGFALAAVPVMSLFLDPAMIVPAIPIVAMVDTNCNPQEIDYVIPSNDDAIRAIKLLVAKVADAVLEGKAMRKEEDLEQKPEEQTQARSDRPARKPRTEKRESAG